MSSKAHFVLRNSEPEVIEDPEEMLATGVWTPWAQIQCVECVDTSNSMWRGDVAAIAEVRPREDWEAAGICDECGARIWISEEIAAEQRLVKELVKLDIPARMQQTGGMCSAAEVWKADESAYIMATEMGEGDTVGPVYCVGLYHGDPENGYDDYEYFEPLAFDQAISKISELWGGFQN